MEILVYVVGLGMPTVGLGCMVAAVIMHRRRERRSK